MAIELRTDNRPVYSNNVKEGHAEESLQIRNSDQVIFPQLQSD